MYRHEKKYIYSGIDGTNNCCMFTLPLKGWYRSLSATQLSIFEIGVYHLNFHETWYLSFVVNLKFTKQFRTLYKKWRHIVTIPFHFEVNVFRVFQLAWITIYSATFKIKGDLVIKHVFTNNAYISAHFSWTHLNYSLLVLWLTKFGYASFCKKRVCIECMNITKNVSGAWLDTWFETKQNSLLLTQYIIY